MHHLYYCSYFVFSTPGELKNSWWMDLGMQTLCEKVNNVETFYLVPVSGLLSCLVSVAKQWIGWYSWTLAKKNTEPSLSALLINKMVSLTGKVEWITLIPVTWTLWIMVYSWLLWGKAICNDVDRMLVIVQQHLLSCAESSVFKMFI